jgi:hypothetical protein
MTFVVAFVTEKDNLWCSNSNLLGGNGSTSATKSMENVMYIVKMLPDEALYLGVSWNCLKPTILGLIVG